MSIFLYVKIMQMRSILCFSVLFRRFNKMIDDIFKKADRNGVRSNNWLSYCCLLTILLYRNCGGVPCNQAIYQSQWYRQLKKHQAQLTWSVCCLTWSSGRKRFNFLALTVFDILTRLCIILLRTICQNCISPFYNFI